MHLRFSGIRLFDGQRFLDGCSITLQNGRIRGITGSDGDAAPRAVVAPGLIDAHLHLHQIALFLGEAALHDVREADELVARLRAAGSAGWALGNRLDHLAWRDHAAELKRRLDVEFPRTPARVLFSDGHSGVLNEAALQPVIAWIEAGRLRDVHLERDADGRHTGVAADGNLELAALPLSDTGAQSMGADRLAAAAAECSRHGLTAVHDLLVTLPEYLALRDAELSGLRVFAFISFEHVDELIRLRERDGRELDTAHLRVTGVKCFADGSLGSGGALLSQSYLTDPTNRGFEVLGTGEIEGLARRCLDHGLQLAVHALGDRGVANVLDAFERALGDDAPSSDHRFRIEHAELIGEEDIARCRRLGVVASMQPYHFTDDARWLPQRVPAELCRRVSLWKRLIDAGVPVCFGSDAPFTNISPVAGIRSAVRRLETVAPAHRAFFTDDALTVEQALACYTSAAAHAVFEEASLGSVAAGRVADLTVFDAALERVLMTVVGGRVTWLHDEAGTLLDATAIDA
jgi:predicted amidohydrolase YtcJ